jgi:hypothetical protein
LQCTKNADDPHALRAESSSRMNIN